jgi:hypothetical protein
VYDVIIVDGVFFNFGRLRCTEQVVKILRPGDVVILDNSDWLPRSAEMLRQAGLIEIDFAGIDPLNTCAGTTSVFFHSDFRPTFLSSNHPIAAIGGRIQNWEAPEHPYNQNGSRFPTAS